MAFFSQVCIHRTNFGEGVIDADQRRVIATMCDRHQLSSPAPSLTRSMNKTDAIQRVFVNFIHDGDQDRCQKRALVVAEVTCHAKYTNRTHLRNIMIQLTMSTSRCDLGFLNPRAASICSEFA